MILDIFSELQTAEPPHDTAARHLYERAIEQARLADELGYGCWWAVEHHTSPEFSWSSAPELILTAIARHTRRIRLGTSGILSPYRINHPVRVAERAALVDVLSNGRLELGLARTGGAEWETFGVDGDATKAELREALHVVPRIWTGHHRKGGAPPRGPPTARLPPQPDPGPPPAAVADGEQPRVLPDGRRARRRDARQLRLHPARAHRLADRRLRAGPRALPPG